MQKHIRKVVRKQTTSANRKPQNITSLIVVVVAVVVIVIVIVNDNDHTNDKINIDKKDNKFNITFVVFSNKLRCC